MNGDGFTVPQDVLLIINDINAQDARQLPAEYAPGKPFVDTTGDQFLAPQDVLIVINAIGAGNGAPYELIGSTTKRR